MLKKITNNPIVLFFAILGAAALATQCFHAHLYFAGAVMVIFGLSYLFGFIDNSLKYIKAH
jgi:hypothetical protein